MAKLLDDLNQQLKTEYKKEAEDCLKIYNALDNITEHVWRCDWTCLVKAIRNENYVKVGYEPNEIGKIFLKGLEIDK